MSKAKWHGRFFFFLLKIIHMKYVNWPYFKPNYDDIYQFKNMVFSACSGWPESWIVVCCSLLHTANTSPYMKRSSQKHYSKNAYLMIASFRLSKAMNRNLHHCTCGLKMSLQLSIFKEDIYVTSVQFGVQQIGQKGGCPMSLENPIVNHWESQDKISMSLILA